MQAVFTVPQTEPKEVCRAYNPNTPMGKPKKGRRYFDLLEAASHLDNATCRKILDSVKEGVFLPEPFFGMTADMIAEYLCVDSRVVYAAPHRSDGFYVAENIEEITTSNLEAYATTTKFVPFTQWRESTFPNGAKITFKGWRCTLYSPRAILLLAILCMNHSTVATRIAIATGEVLKNVHNAPPQGLYKTAPEIIRYVSQIEGIAPGTQILITTPDGKQTSSTLEVNRSEEHKKVWEDTRRFESDSILNRCDEDLNEEPHGQPQFLTVEMRIAIDKCILDNAEVFGGNMNDKDIARLFKTSPLSVRSRMQRMVKKVLFDDAEEAKPEPKPVDTDRSYNAHKLSEEKKNELQGFLLVNAKPFGGKMTMKAIGEKFGINSSVVQYYINKLLTKQYQAQRVA